MNPAYIAAQKIFTTSRSTGYAIHVFVTRKVVARNESFTNSMNHSNRKLVPSAEPFAVEFAPHDWALIIMALDAFNKSIVPELQEYQQRVDFSKIDGASGIVLPWSLRLLNRIKKELVAHEVYDERE